MKNSKKSNAERKQLSLNKVKVSVISNPERITGGGDGGWTIRKDKDKNC